MIKRVLLVAIILLIIGLLPAQAEAITTITKEDVLRTVRDNFTARKESFTINMRAGTLREIGTDTDLLAAAVSVDDPDTSMDGEYGEAVISY